MAQLVRAPPCHGGGRGFESRWGRLKEYARVAELADAQDLKSCCSDTVPVRPRSRALLMRVVFTALFSFFIFWSSARYEN